MQDPGITRVYKLTCHVHRGFLDGISSTLGVSVVSPARSASWGPYVGAPVQLRKHSSLPEIKGDRLIDCYSIADSEASLWFSMIIVAIM